MNNPINVILTGSDTAVKGVAALISYQGIEAYEFKSTDETLHLIIARDSLGNWHRVGGSEPYFSGWVYELAEQVGAHSQY